MSQPSSCYIIIKSYPCDDPYYPPSDVIFGVCSNILDAVKIVYKIYDSNRIEIDNDIEEYYFARKNRENNEKNSFLRSFSFPDFINFRIVKYDMIDSDVEKCQPSEEIFDLMTQIINPDFSIVERKN